VAEETNTDAEAGAALKQPKRYLIVLNDVGFLYSHFWALAIAIQNAGWEVVIAARNGASPQRAIDAGMRYIPLNLKVGIGGPLAEIKSILALRAAIQSCCADLVHLVSIKNVLLGGMLVRGRRNVSLLGAITGLGSMFVERKLLYSFLRPMVLLGLKSVFRNSHSVMAVENPDDRRFFIQTGVVSQEKCFVIPGAGLPKNAIVPVAHQNAVPIVLCVCRMIRNKGIPQLIEAARILHGEGHPFELWLVGDIDVDNPTSLTREELQSAEADGAIKWLGQRNDIVELLSRTDIFCLPTYYREGLPRALVEASAAGCAIVTADVPGCREVVVDGLNGCLVLPRDTASLADALRSLLRDPETRRRMGLESRRRFEKLFTMSRSLGAFNQCYAALDLLLRVGCREE
jgi:glycosyltransferase involved in cell wall biosynthesis